MNKLYLIIALVSICCSPKRAHPAGERLRLDCEDFVIVTFDEISSNPKSYHDKKIRIKGYFNNSFENVGIYESRFSSIGIWTEFDRKLNIDDEKLHGQNIEVIGIFDSERHGHLDGFLGEINVLCLMGK